MRTHTMLAVAALALTVGACSQYPDWYTGVYRGMEGDGVAFNVRCNDQNGHPSKKESTDAICHRERIVAGN